MNKKIRRIVLRLQHEDCRYIIKNKIKNCFKGKLKRQIEELQYQVASLYELLNLSVNITDLKPIEGTLRNIQKANALLLGIFDQVCVKHSLTYWMDYGTLLGAVRHKGFIPWDDDVDVAMPRIDYLKIKEILEHELSIYGLKINEGEGYTAQVYRLIYEGTPIQLDIFPYDYCDDKYQHGEAIQMIECCHAEFYDRYLWDELYYGIRKFPRNELNNILSAKGFNTIDPSEAFCILTGAECFPYKRAFVFDKNIIYPLKKITFEGIKLEAPNSPEQYLSNIYGDYMSFPRFKVLGHSNINDVKNVDISSYQKQLREIYSKVSKSNGY